MLIAQVSDPHVMLPDDPIAGFVDTPARLRAVVATLEGLPIHPDVVLLTGDLVNRGLPGEYELLRELLAPLSTRTLVVPGNHDDREELRRAFADQPELPTRGHLSYTVDDLPLRLVALDSTLDGRDDGELDAERLDWLARALDDGGGRPTVLFLHHPPVPTGMWWMDYGGLKGRDGLLEVLLAHPEVVRVVAGHVHRATSVVWAGTVVSTAPSPFYATTPPLGDVPEPLIVAVPAAVPVFHWDEGDGVLVASELDPPGDHPTLRFPTVFGDRWDEYAARARSGAEMPSAR